MRGTHCNVEQRRSRARGITRVIALASIPPVPTSALVISVENVKSSRVTTTERHATQEEVPID